MEGQAGPFFLTALESSQNKAKVHLISIRHGNGGHYLFHDYERESDAQERCDALNKAVMEWLDQQVGDYLKTLDGANWDEDYNTERGAALVSIRGLFKWMNMDLEATDDR